MKTIIFLLSFLQAYSCFAQDASRHFRYDFNTAAYVQFEMLPSETKVVQTHIIWHTVRDSRFLLIYLEEVKTESDFGDGLNKASWDDTLLFDLKTNKVYMHKSKKCYVFERRRYSLNREAKFISADTLLDCAPPAPESATPTPTLWIEKRGISIFKTKRFTFIYRDEIASNIDLQRYFEAYRDFAFSTGKPPFAF